MAAWHSLLPEDRASVRADLEAARVSCDALEQRLDVLRMVVERSLYGSMGERAARAQMWRLGQQLVTERRRVEAFERMLEEAA